MGLVFFFNRLPHWVLGDSFASYFSRLTRWACFRKLTFLVYGGTLPRSLQCWARFLLFPPRDRSKGFYPLLIGFRGFTRQPRTSFISHARQCLSPIPVGVPGISPVGSVPGYFPSRSSSPRGPVFSSRHFVGIVVTIHYPPLYFCCVRMTFSPQFSVPECPSCPKRNALLLVAHHLPTLPVLVHPQVHSLDRVPTRPTLAINVPLSRASNTPFFSFLSSPLLTAFVTIFTFAFSILPGTPLDNFFPQCRLPVSKIARFFPVPPLSSPFAPEPLLSPEQRPF